MTERKTYLALGDSMSIDRYPDEDARERHGHRAQGLGAASLLYENHPRLWPEFDGQDLISKVEWCTLENLATDGAVIETVLQTQLPREPRGDVWLATLTVGGNDLLEALCEQGVELPEGIFERLTRVVELARARLPNARLILNTIYDPTDGSGQLPGWPDALPLESLHRINEHIRKLAAQTPNTVLADVHAHFQGKSEWYLPRSPIEPGAMGASEIRRLWWQASRVR